MISALTTKKSLAISRVFQGLSVLLILATVVLLTLGALTTSFRSGMADRVWPTEPWYLVVNGRVWTEPTPGFLLEHTHRAAGFSVGFLSLLLVLVAWLKEPSRKFRVVFFIAFFLLTLAYGTFHREMMQAWNAREARMERPFPSVSAWSTFLSASLVLFIAAAPLLNAHRGRWLRFLSTVILISVMAQGLLGGFRVYFDQLYGESLAQIHGVFAQLVFSLMVLLPILNSGARRFMTRDDRARLTPWAVLLPIMILVQLIVAVLVRHEGSVVAQRLHFLLAFLITGWLVVLAVKLLISPVARQSFRFTIMHLLLILAVQLILGVEAWMLKFSAQGSQGLVPPSQRTITLASGIIRSGHVLIGTALLASSFALLLRIRRAETCSETLSATRGESLVHHDLPEELPENRQRTREFQPTGT